MEPDLQPRDCSLSVHHALDVADVPAPSSGVVHLLVEEEAEVPQGTPIAMIET